MQYVKCTRCCSSTIQTHPHDDSVAIALQQRASLHDVELLGGNERKKRVKRIQAAGCPPTIHFIVETHHEAVHKEQQAHSRAHRRPRWTGWLLSSCSIPAQWWATFND